MDFFGPRFAGRRYLRYAELVELGIVNNRGTLKNLVDRGALPEPVRLGGRTMLFDTVELATALLKKESPDRGESVGAQSTEGSRPCVTTTMPHRMPPG